MGVNPSILPSVTTSRWSWSKAQIGGTRAGTTRVETYRTTLEVPPELYFRPMKHLRVIDQIGNKRDYLAESVPRIGERIFLEYGIGSEPVSPHYFRVKDVMYRLDQPVELQVAILTEEETDAEDWPS